MRLAILSGKGGTGKTTVAVNLALSLSSNYPTSYVDYDVEEPNGFLFLQPQIKESHPVLLPYPEIEESCTLCGRCSEACQYHALAMVGQKIMVFPEICHGCGTCVIACPSGSIVEAKRTIGRVDCGLLDKLSCYQGVLQEGESLAVPVIRELHRIAEAERAKEQIIIADCPPGSSCSVIHAASDADLAILVTEPTLFGLHDLKIAIRLMREMHLNFSVVLNKDDTGSLVRDYCARAKIPILASIPFDLEIAELYSQGKTLVSQRKWANLFEALGQQILTSIQSGGIPG